MQYQFNCDACNKAFSVDLPLSENAAPCKKPCPLCKVKGEVYRDYSTISITYDTVDVNTRARQVAGSDFTDLMKQIDKGAGENSTMNV